MGKPHLSHSQMDMLARCGEAYRRRYIEGEKIPPAIVLHVGTGSHAAAEANFEQKIESHKDLPKADIIEAAVAGFEDEVEQQGVGLTKEEKSRGKLAIIGEAKDLVVSLAGLYADEQAPDYQPLAVEEEVLIPLPNASHDLLGYIDLIDDKGRVVDFKTSGKSKPQSEADTSVQLTIYAAAYKLKYLEAPTELRLDIQVKTKKPKRQVLSTTRTDRDSDALVARMNTSMKIIQAGVFMPAPPGSWQCSPAYCGYWPTCPYVNSSREDAAHANDS